MHHVEIQVGERIDPEWSGWFDDLTVVPVGQRQSMLVGTINDQAALYGILAKLRDLNLALISVSVDAGSSKGGSERG